MSSKRTDRFAKLPPAAADEPAVPATPPSRAKRAASAIVAVPVAVTHAALAIAFAYARPALALLLLVSPIVCTMLSLDASDDAMASCALLAVWGLVMALHALPRVGSRPDAVSELCVLALAVVKTLQILHEAHYAHARTVWVLATSAAGASVLLAHLDAEWIHSVYQDGLTVAVSSDPGDKMSPRMGLVSMALIGGSGLVRATILDSVGGMTALLILAEAGVSLLITTRSTRKGAAVELNLSMLYLQACTLPFLDSATSMDGILVLSVMGAMLLMTLATEMSGRPRLIDMIESIVLLCVDLVGSAATWQVVVIVCVGVLTRTMYQPWYTAHVDFPLFLRNLARGALELISAGPKLFMELTNRPEVQDFMINVVPEISGPRGLIYRILAPIYRGLLDGRDGLDYTLVPLHVFSCLLAFVVGPLVAGFGVLAQVFQSGAVFAQSRWFWAFSAFGTMLFVLMSQVAAGPRVSMAALLFIGSDYRRTYTNSGLYALYSSLILCGACIVLFVIRSRPPSEEETASGTQGRARTKRPDPPSCGQILRNGGKRLRGMLVAPAFIIAAAAVFVLVTVSLSQGSPIDEVSVSKVPLLPADVAVWLKITPLDRTAVAASTLIAFLVNVFGSDVRLAFLGQYLNRMILRQIQCLPCLCIPGGEAVNAVAGAIRSILEEQKQTEWWEQVMQPQFTNSSSGRSLLFDFDPNAECTRPSSACGSYLVCLADIVNPIVQLQEFIIKLVFKGLAEGVHQLVEHVFNRIPGFRLVNDAFGDIAHLQDFEDFDALSHASFADLPGRFVGGLLGTLPVPPTVSTTWLVLVLILVVGMLLLLVRFGLFEALLDSAFSGIGASLAIGFLSVLCMLVFVGYEAESELRNWEYQARVTFFIGVLMWWGICFGLLFFASFLELGSASAKQLAKRQKAKQTNTKGRPARLTVRALA